MNCKKGAEDHRQAMVIPGTTQSQDQQPAFPLGRSASHTYPASVQRNSRRAPPTSSGPCATLQPEEMIISKRIIGPLCGL